jgi:uncharacterized protein DUF1573
MNTRANLVAMTVIGTLGLAGLAMGQNAGEPASLGSQPPAAQPSAAQPSTDAKPQLVFEELEHDFGRINDQHPAEEEFKFTNKGTGTLKFILPLKATCGCTAGNPRSPKNPNVDQAEFAPGESGFIKVTYNPAGKHGDANQRITVTSNDPQQPEQILKIHAFVKTTISFDPPLVGFGEVRVGEPAKQIVKVNGPAPDFKVNYASVSKGRYISVKVLDTKPVKVEGEDLSQTTLELTFNGNAPRGPLQAVTTVRTSNEQYPLADIQVMAEVVGDLQVLPPRVNVGIIESGQAFTKTFRVNSRTGKAFKITGITQKSSLPGQLEISYNPAEPGNESAYLVEVKGQGPSTPTPISATLTLATDNATDQTVEVMLNGAVRPPVAPAFTPQTPSPAGPANLPAPAQPAPTPTDKP